MPLMEPTIKAYCDKCYDESDEMGLTALAQSGSYDERNVPGELKRQEWKIFGNKTICPNCAEAYETDADLEKSLAD